MKKFHYDDGHFDNHDPAGHGEMDHGPSEHGSFDHREHFDGGKTSHKGGPHARPLTNTADRLGDHNSEDMSGVADDYLDLLREKSERGQRGRR
jgi:hypothetical protein